MGCTFQGLSPVEQKELSEVWPKMIETMRIGGALIHSTPYRIRSRVWFGDISPKWMGELQRKLYQMATIANTQQFEVSGIHYKQRDAGIAAHAVQPDPGWGMYTEIRTAQSTQFRIRLDVGWNSLPKFRTTITPMKSKFQTIVHEVTHLVLYTRDLSYGGPGCKTLALNSSTDAKNNADSWALFVDDVRRQMPHRPPDPILSAIWKSYTARRWHYRSDDLRKLDDSLAAFEQGPTASARRALILAFRHWYQQNKQERDKRNVANVINRMRDYVDALELNEL